VATDEVARDYLKSRGISSLPVTIIDDDLVIIGYYPRRLIPALNLDVQVDLSGKTRWLGDKYETMLGAAVRAVRQLSNEQLQRHLPWRERWTLRDLMMHVLSFPELAWLSHQHGSMSTDDMQASNTRLKALQMSEEVAAYGEGVRQHLIAFLQSNDTAAFDRVVPAHYGGEVTVLELLTIILSHSTHHLKQAYWFIDHDLGISLTNPATDEDLEGIATPAALF
jgi:uncharacterized damage-inducible protein DinB